ncbi:MAG: hypothetical protein ABI876_18705, partial [Bacteroidota bacterium]
MMSEFASQIVSQIGAIFEQVNVSPSHPIAAFPLEGAQNYLYVVYSTNGMPLQAGAMLESMDKRQQNRAAKEIQGLASSGFAASFRVVELISEDMARNAERWMMDLFHAALPLANGFEVNRGLAAITHAQETPAPARRGRGKAAATSAKRRGR